MKVGGVQLEHQVQERNKVELATAIIGVYTDYIWAFRAAAATLAFGSLSSRAYLYDPPHQSTIFQLIHNKTAQPKAIWRSRVLIMSSSTLSSLLFFFCPIQSRFLHVPSHKTKVADYSWFMMYFGFVLLFVY